MKNSAKVRSPIPIALGLVPGVALLIQNGHGGIAILLIAFALMIFLAGLFPNSDISQAIFHKDLLPARGQTESRSMHYLQHAKWWGVGALTIPIAYMISYLPSAYDGLVFIATIIGWLFGAPCLLKSFESLAKAFWYRNEATNNQINQGQG